MKKKLLLKGLLVPFMLFYSACTWAFSVKNDDGVWIYYNIISETDRTCEVTHSDSGADSYVSRVVSIPSSVTYDSVEYAVTSIGSEAFYSCSKLTEVTIPNSVTSIGNRAFSYCTSLAEVTIGESVTSIGGSAFYSCSKLTEVTIPNSVTSIGSSAFRDCKKITSFTSLNPEPPTCKRDSFYGMSTTSSCTLFVPEGTEDAYASATGWQDFLYINDKVYVAVGDKMEVDGIYYKVIATKEVEVTWGGELETSGTDSYTDVITIPTTVDYNNVTYTVTGIGEYAFENCSSLAEITIPNSVTTIGNRAFENCSSLSSLPIGSGVTTIGDYAFFNCTSVAELTIGEVITSIGNRAFDNCTGLKILRLEDGEETLSFTTNSSYTPFTSCPIEALYLGRKISYSSSYSPFRDKTTLSSLTIGDMVTSISDYEFYGCTALEMVDIPNSVTSMGTYAFYNCKGLKQLNLSNNLTSIEERTFYNCSSISEVEIPNSVSSIGAYAFYQCSGLATLTIGSGVTTIGDYAFFNCTSVAELTIGEVITSIGNRAFNNCSRLKTLRLEDGEEALSFTISSSYTPFNSCPIETLYLGRDMSYTSRYAPFMEKTTLKSLTIGEKVKTIGDYEFYGCTAIETVDIPNSVVAIGEYAFRNCSRLKTLIIEDGEEILSLESSSSYTPFTSCPIEALYLGRKISYSSSYSPFRDKTTLSSLTIGDMVTSISDYEFYGCTALEMVDLPNSVTSIGTYAFSNCSKMKNAKIGSSVGSINSYAFNNCSSLMELTTLNPTPPNITSTTFDGVDKKTCVLYVPVGSLREYWVHSYWGEFFYINEGDGIDNVLVDNDDVQIKGIDGAIVVTGDNVPVYVYTINGMLIGHDIVQGEKSISLPQGNIYIVKAGTQTKKVKM